MVALTLQLTNEQVKRILVEGIENPLYNPLLTAYPQYAPIITIESLYNSNKITGYWLSEEGNIDFTEGFLPTLKAVNGVAPTKEAVERTVIEYKLLHLIKANSLKGNKYNIVKDKRNNSILLLDNDVMLCSPLTIEGEHSKCVKFITDYKDLLLEYFSTFNTNDGDVIDKV